MKSLFALLIPLLFCACHPAPQSKQTKPPSAVAAQHTATTDYPEVKTWLDDFKNFRNAVYHRDMPKLETYFRFPLSADSSQIWSGILNDYEQAEKARATHSRFTAQDFEKYDKQLFQPAFVKSLLKIKSEKLFTSGESDSPKITDVNGGYKMYASFDRAAQTLTLNLAFSGIQDAKGEDEGEGESNINYTFTIIQGKYLQFKRIDVAG